MTRLQDLLIQEVADLSTESNLADALRVGRRRLLIRRAVGAGGATALIAVLTGSIVWATTSLPDQSEPAAPKPKLGVELTLDDAVPALEGTDYTAVRTVTSTPDHIEINPFLNESFVYLTEDHQALRRADEWKKINAAGVMAVRAKFTLIDPATGNERELPVYDQWLQRPLRLSANKLYFQIGTVQGEGEYEPGTQLPAPQGQVAVFDRVTWTWSTLDWDVPEEFEWEAMAIGADARAWLTGVEPFDPSTVSSENPYDPQFDLWSGALDDTSDTRQETPPVADAGAKQVGSWLLWQASGQTDAIAVNTADGAERTIENVSSCLLSTPAGGSTPLLAGVDNCEGSDLAESTLLIRTLDGDDVLELRDRGLSASVLGERYLALEQLTRSGSTPYLYELSTGKLLKMPSRVVAIEGDRAVLETADGTGDDQQSEFTVIDLN